MIRRTIGSAVLVTALSAAALLAAAPAQAIPVCKAGYQCDRIYYEDNTRTTVVGGSTKFCDGSTENWGRTSRYVATHQAQCNPI
ncbi:DUF6289 family protein [Actinosynnema sp. NPDC047251]|uniref:Putative secreted protein n=1 Tax=Saccharothrix espanaensis (strain ATCC 51144 / DSM 44229 / JCM 9112 / NBRC 15066 / NRRL 15764) TaxID=1179773 RepID=K0JSZ9_SACES|nr:DUF6289 family protein [Saccharothrix espanaensis]CCH30885.1 putative secreted protein [Saccharothrix espanaensis DSM 44229]